MMPDDTGRDDSPGGLSRRSLIKKGVVAGGLVWAAPVLTSASASAAGKGTPAPTTTSTTTTQPQPCDCSFCATAGPPGGPPTLFFTCTPTTADGCECLCKCGGVPGHNCAEPDPCTVPVNCVPTTEALCGVS